MARSTCAPRSCVFRSDSQVMTADLKEMLDEGKKASLQELHAVAFERLAEILERFGKSVVAEVSRPRERVGSTSL